MNMEDLFAGDEDVEKGGRKLTMGELSICDYFKEVENMIKE